MLCSLSCWSRWDSSRLCLPWGCFQQPCEDGLPVGVLPRPWQVLIRIVGWVQSHGILSDDPAENPYFSSWNHVAIWYCSSDSHLGDAPAGASSANASVNGM